MLTFLLVGKTGAGKSSFINTTMGCRCAATARFRPCTRTAKGFARRTRYGTVCLIDTPGLGVSELRDAAHLAVLRERVDLRHVDKLLYVSSLADTRLGSAERGVLRMLSGWIDPVLWRWAWLVLGFAACVPHSQIARQSECRRQLIERHLQGLLTPGRFRGFAVTWVLDNRHPQWHRQLKQPCPAGGVSIPPATPTAVADGLRAPVE